MLQDFVYLLSAFSVRAAVEDKVNLIFMMYDSDGDGLVSTDDMELMLRQLAGSTLRSALHSSALAEQSTAICIYLQVVSQLERHPAKYARVLMQILALKLSQSFRPVYAQMQGS